MTTPTSLRRALRLAAGTAGAALLTLGLATGASAHVTVTPGEATADSYAVLTFGVPHGCDGSATTEVAIQIPAEITSVTPTVNPNWTVEMVMADLDPPVTDSHGNELAERVDRVVYSANTPLPDGLRDAFELSVRLPDLPGETLAFPTVQTCEEGDVAWTQVAEDGDGHDLETPAPLVHLTVASTAGDTAEAADDGPVEDETAATSATTTDGGPGVGLGVAGLVAGLTGAILGAVALSRTRRQA